MSKLVFEIHDWTLKVDENMLCRPDREVYLEPRLVNLLLFLARNAGTVFGRDALINEVWDGAEVTDQVVTQSIFELRKILKDGRQDATDYIVTIPKRGYKLAVIARALPVGSVSSVDEQPVSVSNPQPFDDEASSTADDHKDAAVSSPFPAGPLTRAVSNGIPRPLRGRRMIGFDIFLVVILIALVGGLIYTYTYTYTYTYSKPQVRNMRDPYLLTLRFISDINEKSEGERLAYGISRALMADVTAITSMRGQYCVNKCVGGILPGKELRVHVTRQPQGTYLDLELRNLATNRVLFSHKYQLSRDNVQEVLQASRTNLQQFFNFSEEKNAVQWPRYSASLLAIIEAQYHFLHWDPIAINQSLQLIDQAILAEPDQTLLLAERYLLGHMQATLAGESESEQLVRIGDHLDQVVDQGGILSDRVLEALTLRAILRGQAQKAASLMDQSSNRGRSALYYILLGKIAELGGHPEAASDAYAQAYLMEPTDLTYLLCQKFGFYSDIEAINPALFQSQQPSEVKLF